MVKNSIIDLLSSPVGDWTCNMSETKVSGMVSPHPSRRSHFKGEMVYVAIP
jgi:hypothetical protein